MIKACTLAVTVIAALAFAAGPSANAQPSPMAEGRSVDWLFVYKFNTRSFPECAANAERACPFGGKPVAYRSGFGQQYVFASSADPELKSGGGCLGDTEKDPIGATFDQICKGNLNCVVWNDQFYLDPKITAAGPVAPAPGAIPKAPSPGTTRATGSSFR